MKRRLLTVLVVLSGAALAAALVVWSGFQSADGPDDPAAPG
jgi:hypothetical protein